MIHQHPEYDLQRAVIRWFRTNYPSYLIFSVPNEATYKNSPHYKSLGVLKGAPDLVMVLPNVTIYLELKSPQGKLSEDQKNFQRVTKSLNQYYYIIRDLDDLRMILRNHLYVEDWCDL